jgi:hypothetical protein
MNAVISEAQLQMHVVALLNAYARPDIEWHHVPNGEQRHPVTARRLKLMGVRKGVADLMFLIDDRSFAVELKAGNGRQSPDQIEWQERFERAGGLYFIARDIDDAVSVLKFIGAFRTNVSITTKADGGGVRRRSWQRQAKAATNSKTTSETAARCRPGFSAET